MSHVNEPPNNSGCCQMYMLLPQTANKVLLLRTTQTTHYTWRSQVCAYIEPSLLCASIIGTNQYFVCYQRRNINIKPGTNLLIYKDILTAGPWCNGATGIVGVSNQYLISLKAHSMRWNPQPTWVTRT